MTYVPLMKINNRKPRIEEEDITPPYIVKRDDLIEWLMTFMAQPSTGSGRVSMASSRNVSVMRCSKVDAKATRDVKGTPLSRFQS